MDYILCNHNIFPSTRILRDSIFSLSGKRFLITGYPERCKNYPIIRYGNSFGNFSKEIGLNSPAFISLCANKKMFSELLLHNSFYTPEYRKDKDLEFPLLIRQTLFGHGGEGIILCKNEEEFKQNWRDNYWTKYIPTQFELRVHVLGDKIVKIFRKDSIEKEEFPIRNNATCHFSIRDPEKYSKLKELINDLNILFSLVEGVNFGFYALDVGWNSDRKEYFIFEANSAPGLNEHTANVYADFLCNRLNL